MLEQKSISRLIFLHIIAILFVILNISNIKIGGFSDVMPLFDLMIIFYFAIFRNKFEIWFIFLMGTWNDALNGNPLGTTALCYIVLVKLFSLLNNRPSIKENFKQVWHQFTAFCLCFLLMKWCILSILSGTMYSATIAIVQLILSSIIYVVMHRFFDYLSLKLLEDN